jgi:hypothetical protein
MSRSGSKSGIKTLLIIIFIGIIAGVGTLYFTQPKTLPPFSWPSLQQTQQNVLQALTQVTQTATIVTQSNKESAIYKFAIVSDSHEDTTFFPNIIAQISKRHDISFVAHLGDLTNAGEVVKLQQAKTVLDQLSQPVYILPGDHDLNWVPQHDLANFRQVFQETRTYYAFSRGAERYVFIDNSNINTGLDSNQWQWLESELAAHASSNIYVFMSTPISNPYLAFKAMGSQNDVVLAQAKRLGQLLSKYHTKVIFAGDTHMYTQYKDKETGVPIATVGAAGSTKNPLPMYVVVEIFADGQYNVSSIPYSSAIPITGND